MEGLTTDNTGSQATVQKDQKVGRIVLPIRELGERPKKRTLYDQIVQIEMSARGIFFHEYRRGNRHGMG